MTVQALISNHRAAALVALCSVAIWPPTGNAVEAPNALETINREVVALCEKSRDAIVKVHAQRTLPFGGLPMTPSHCVGTGFFIDGEGRLLTAATVVNDATNCWIDCHGRQVPAAVLGRDPQTNVALL